jgi:iron complex outermembrane receptor protein
MAIRIPLPASSSLLAHARPWLLAIVPVLGAQTVPAPRGDIQQLSPFEVNSSQDVGYIATHSLAGSRLNSSLKDTPAIIDVFTKEFLEDIGATTLDEAMAYANNSQPDDGDTLRVNNGQTQTAAGKPFNFRSRGILGNSTRNYFETRLSTDFYSTERLDDSRGPNSVLFGIGSAGGIINNSPKRAQFGPAFVETQLQAGSQTRIRATADLNLPLIPQKLGFRFNAMHTEKGGWREYMANRRKAATAALTFRPFAKTEIRAEAEKGLVRGTIARNYPVVDGISLWWKNQQPTVASVATAAPTAAETAAGLTRPVTASRLVLVENQNFFVDVRNYFSTAIDAPTASTILNDPTRVPYEANAAGPGARTLHDFENITAIVEQRFTANLAGEIGFYHEAGDWTNYDVGADNVTIRGDPNGLLRNPTTFRAVTGFSATTDSAGNLINPNRGGVYYEAGWRRNLGHTDSDNLRATLAYDQDLGRWGRYRFAGMLQHQVENSTGFLEREVWLGAPFNADPTNDNNAVWRRAYITLGDAVSQRAPDPQQSPNLSVSYPGRTAPLTNGWVMMGGGTRSRRTIDSQMMALQGSWWRHRIVATLGYRRDNLEQSRTTPGLDTAGIWAGSAGLPSFAVRPSTSSFEFTGETTTAGVVLHARPWLSVFANASRNLGLPDYSRLIGPDGDVPPPPKGSGFDTGLLLSLRNDRIVARVSYFTTDVTDQVGTMGVDTAFTSRYNTIISILEDPNGDGSTADRLYTAAQMAKYSSLRPRAVANGDSLDSVNQGFEARLTANVGQGLRFIVNYSYNLQERENVYKRTLPLYDQLDTFLVDLQQANPGVNVGAARGTQGQSIAELIAVNRADLSGRQLDFEGAYGNRKHKANFFANYSIKEGALKGWSTGLGARYLSPITAGRVSSGPGQPLLASNQQQGVGNNGPTVYGDDSFSVDGMLRYQTRLNLLGRPTRLSVQLNVRNLLDERGIEERRYKSDGKTLDRFVLLDPREVTLSATVRY